MKELSSEDSATLSLGDKLREHFDSDEASE